MSFIFYIAILLVLLGFIFIYTSVEVRRPASRGQGSAPASSGNEPHEEPVPSVRIDPLPAEEDTVTAGSQAETAAAPSEFNVVLYMDDKGVVLSDSSTGILEENGAYDEFTRIGGGTAVIGSDALSVRIDKKLFRYDYHRIREIKLREGVSVVYLKGDSRGNIFIAENVLFARVLDETFSRYSRKG
jgi:hypothetical protein